MLWLVVLCLVAIVVLTVKAKKLTFKSRSSTAESCVPGLSCAGPVWMPATELCS